MYELGHSLLPHPGSSAQAQAYRGHIRVELIDTAKKFGFLYSQKGIVRPHSPNFHIHVSVINLYIPTFGQCCQLLAELSAQLG